jgi:bifunctional non-homologous end joining protein LigD
MAKVKTPAKRKKSPAKKPSPSARKSLTRYRQKRDFTKTPEPSGATTRSKPAKSKSLFFCVQKHLASHLHYDFRLEHNGVLLSWAVPKGPSLNPRDKRLAMRVEDHPFDYRDFEGVIPEGYGAGVVMLWEQGTWRPEEGFENIAAALKKGELKFSLDGVKLKGSWVLVRTGAGGGGTSTGEREQWLLIKHRDNWAGDVDIATFAPRSVKTDRDFEQIVTSDPDVWESHKPAKADLQKIVDKVLALREKENAGPKTAKAPKRSKRGA